ncbi:MAG: hypothetical protein IKP50_06245 [Bacilli bacterium]|nr:hypothetical protein [Bacilli bacterium]
MRRNPKRIGLISGIILSAAFSGALAIGALSGVKKQEKVMTSAEIDPADLVDGWNYDEDENALVYYDSNNPTYQYELTYFYVRQRDNQVDLTYTNTNDPDDTHEITVYGSYAGGSGLIEGQVYLNGSQTPTSVSIAEGSATFEYDELPYNEGWNYVSDDYALLWYDGEEIVSYVLESVYLCQYSQDAILTYTNDSGPTVGDNKEVVLTSAYINQTTEHLVGYFDEISTYVDLNIGDITPQETEYWTYQSGEFTWVNRWGSQASTSYFTIETSVFHDYTEDQTLNYYEVQYRDGNDLLPILKFTSASYEELSGATAQGYQVTGNCVDPSVSNVTITVDTLQYTQEAILDGWIYDPQTPTMQYYIHNQMYRSYVIGTPHFYLYGTEENNVTFIFRAEITGGETTQETFTLTDATYSDPGDHNGPQDKYQVIGEWDGGSRITLYFDELDVEFIYRWVYDEQNGFQYWLDIDDICNSTIRDVIFTNYGNGKYYNEAYVFIEAWHSEGQTPTLLRTDTLFIEQVVLVTDPRLLQDEPGVMHGLWNGQEVEFELYSDDDHLFIENNIQTGWNYLEGLQEIVYIADENDSPLVSGDRYFLVITSAIYYPGKRKIDVQYVLNDENGEQQKTGSFSLQNASVLSEPGNDAPGVIKGYAEDITNIMMELQTYYLNTSTQPYFMYDEDNSELYMYYPNPENMTDISTELQTAEYNPDTGILTLNYYIYYKYNGVEQTDGEHATLSDVQFIRMPDPDNAEPALRTGLVEGYCEQVDDTIQLIINVPITSTGTAGWKYDQESGLSWIDEFGLYYNAENEKLEITDAIFNSTSNEAKVNFYIEEFDETKTLNLTRAEYLDLSDQSPTELYTIQGYNDDLTDGVLQFQVQSLTVTDGVSHWTWYQGDLTLVNPWYPDISVTQTAVTYYEATEVVELVYQVIDPTNNTSSSQTLTLTEAEVIEEFDAASGAPGLVSGHADFIDGMVDPISVNVYVAIDRPSLFTEGWNFIDEQLVWYDETLGVCDTSFYFVTIYYNLSDMDEKLAEYAEVKYAIYGLSREDPDAVTYKIVKLDNVKVGAEPDGREPGFLTGTYTPLDAGVSIEFSSDQFTYKRIGEEDENPATITPEQAEEIIDFMPEIEPETEEEQQRQERNEESLAQLSEKTAAEILATVTTAQDNIDQELADKIAAATTEEEVAQARQEHQEKREIIETVTEASVVVGAGQQTAAQEGKKVNDALPEDNGLDESMEKTLNDFYTKQMNYLLGKEEIPDKEEKSSGNRGVLRAPEGNSTGINMNISKEEYGKMIKFVDTAVSNMKDAALQIRKCSAASMKASVNVYISKVKISSFREFDEAAANAEFVAAVYRAIMLNMQQQVIEALKREYKPSNNAEKEAQYKAQLAACEDYDTFEQIVLEVLRLKYVSLTNQEIDIEQFRPIYDDIFKSWALDDPSINPTNITLEELTKATIEKTTTKATKVAHRESISSQESTFLIVFGCAVGVVGAAAIAAPIIIKSRKRRLAK